jgi:hypothetical protein
MKCPSLGRTVTGCRLDGNSTDAAGKSNVGTVSVHGASVGKVTSLGAYNDYAAVMYTIGYSTTDNTNNIANHCLNYQYATIGVAGDMKEEWNCSPFLYTFPSTARDNYSLHDGNTWYARVPMARWQNGTSNQLIFGEKWVPTDALGTETWMWRHDQNFLTFVNPNDGRDFAIGRAACERYPLWDPKRAIPSAGVPCYFGSWHTSVCQFLIGDGSVHNFSITTSGHVLGELARVDSGETASLP